MYVEKYGPYLQNIKYSCKTIRKIINSKKWGKNIQRQFSGKNNCKDNKYVKMAQPHELLWNTNANNNEILFHKHYIYKNSELW